MARTLGQFLKLAPENIVHLKLLRYFPRDVQVMRSLGVEIAFLEQD
jgi:hypothetical protein